MKTKILNLINIFLSVIGGKLVSKNQVRYINMNLRGDEIAYLTNYVDPKIKSFITPFFNYNGEMAQDLFALVVNSFKKNGFFVEFGATDGYEGSNTYLLESSFSWNGILVEPLEIFYSKLVENRKCHCHCGVVSTKSNEYLNIDISHKLSFSKISTNRNGFSVLSISLYDLLQKYNAPSVIDFLSIDVEGYEFPILSSFPWKNNEYKIKFICVEHNRDSHNRELIYNLLTTNNYSRVFKDKSPIDDYYLLNEYLFTESIDFSSEIG